MANALTGNPITVDTAATILTASNKAKVQLIQWIDDGAGVQWGSV